LRARLAIALVGLAAATLCPPAHAAQSLRVGSLTLHRCSAGRSGWCGSLPRALDPTRPSGPGIAIGLRWLPAPGGRGAAHPAIVAVEGGPGYPSIGSLFE